MEHIYLHPMLVHFPIALFITALLLEILSLLLKNKDFHQSAIYLYVFAAILSPVVVRTGLDEAAEWHLVNHPVLNLHQRFALTTMWIAVGSLPFLYLIYLKFTKFFRVAFVITLIMLVTFVSLTAYNGGRLVYEYGVGVER